ncbi:hypothetical protein GNI_176660 [Gregarina niphandrodes]|uniref:Prolyl 4-hydroxylase alpha subunit Fe(2+) 2OG dioxygenase domain-containing protein n=1 Tax=Gregarina niphandrodes TaxID=110365 RepID=A0A023AXG9_GRENI|nr:hypothetical protein GNI_176660 [Gregarina niphandrodes]EZG43327.1 hypothetical protein GNI_176660 [Gregarina niphandrodes]|eukprot:XP_011133416.1 hypothetical protein GNI_176660 [Gregarina niphandrodes]
MVASVVVCCPTSFEGGVLSLVDNRGIQIDFDWSQSALAPENNPDRGSADAGGTDQVMNWACFFCDVDHEVSPVTKGTRLTLTYDVCIESTDSERGDSKRGGGVKAEVEERSGESSGESSDESSDESFGDQKFEVEQKPEVEQGKWNEIAVQIASKVESRNEEQLLILLDKLNGAHRYGYYPAHDYAFGATDTWTGEKDWESQLKGVDLQVYRALTKREWVAKLLVLYADLDLYGPAVHFNVGHSPDDPVSMEDAIDFEELETLRSITELRMINIPQRDPSTIYRYSFWYGYTGNEPIEKRDSYYARTVLVFSKSPITNDKNHTAL